MGKPKRAISRAHDKGAIFVEVLMMHDAGIPKKTIARRLGMNIRTVQRLIAEAGEKTN